MENQKQTINYLLFVPKYVDKGQMYYFNLGLSIISAISACMKKHGYNVYYLNHHNVGSIEHKLIASSEKYV